MIRLCKLKVVALAIGMSTGVVFAQSKEPVKIGVPTALTGPSGDIGAEVKKSIEFAVQEANAKGGIDGRKVEFKILDTEIKPDIARKQAERLALEGYKILIGTISSGESLAMGPMLEKWDAIYMNTMAKSDKLTGDSCTRRMFRVNKADSQDAAIIKPWLATRKEMKWAVVGIDTVWGRGVGAAFKDAAKATNRGIVSEHYTPTGTNDFAPYIRQVKDSGAQAMWVGVTGRDLVNFIKQSKQFGLLDNISASGTNFIIPALLNGVGEPTKGMWGIINYNATINTPENKRFVEAWRKAHNGDDPTSYEGETYTGMQVLFQAIERSKSIKPMDLAKVIRGGSFDTVLGKITIRAEDHQAVMPNYFGEVSMVNGKLTPVIKTVMSAEQSSPAPTGTCKMNPL
ncbi:MAG: ABC transporter substrate-binding protein [Pseudomonadota bacterium]